MISVLMLNNVVDCGRRYHLSLKTDRPLHVSLCNNKRGFVLKLTARVYGNIEVFVSLCFGPPVDLHKSWLVYQNKVELQRHRLWLQKLH